MKNYNDKSSNPKDWTTKKLKAEAQRYYALIREVACYGVKDLKMLNSIEKEFVARDIIVTTELNFN